MLLFFVVLVTVEFLLFIEVGARIGGLETVGLIVGTAFLGLWLLRLQAELGLGRAQQLLMQQGNLEETVLAQALKALAALLLIVPGFVSDGAGLIMLLPPCRLLLARRLVKKAAARTTQGIGGGFTWTFNASSSSPPPKSTDPDVIDAEYTVMDSERISESPHRLGENDESDTEDLQTRDK